ncbi:MAG: ArsB/NhaD family transporter, partial [Bacteroidota bacterium]
NLTNLIAVGYYGVPFWEYARVMLWPAVFVIVLNLILFVLLFRDQLRRGRPPQPAASGEAVPLVQEETPTIPGGPLTTTCNSDETLTRCVEVGLLALLAGLGLAPYLDWPLWEVSTATAVLLTFLALRRRMIAPVELVRKVSWSVIPFVFGLFLVIRAVEPGFYRLLEATHLLALLRTPEQATAAAAVPAAVTAPAAAAAPVGVAAAHMALGLHGVTGKVVTAARFAVLGAVSANLVNNLPAELLFLDLAGSGPALYGLLLGVNLGPNLTIIGSLATILVLSLARQAGAYVSFRDYLRLGLIMTPALLLAALAGLLLAACAGLTAPAI